MSRGKNWTQEEDTFLREHFPEMSDTELAEALGRNPHSVEQRRSRLGIKNTRSWTAEELEYLERRWGVSTVPSIAEKLNRSVNAVKLKAVRIGLPGNPINASELVTFNALINAMGMAGSATWFKDRWKRFGCPIQHRRFHNMRVAMIRIEAFWKWAEQHQDIMDFSRFEAYSLGAEPDWVQEKRRRDVRSRINRSEWTPAEDDRLRFLLSLYKYGYDEISRDLNRSEGAIRRRIASLGIKTLPIRRPGKWWSQEDKDKLVKMRADHESLETIALTLGRSASACRGQYERILNPEMMRRYVRDGKLRLNDCFQRNSCIHYTRALGCDLCGTNCDECEHYQRRNPEDDIPTGYVSSAAGKVGTKRVRRMQG